MVACQGELLQEVGEHVGAAYVERLETVRGRRSEAHEPAAICQDLRAVRPIREHLLWPRVGDADLEVSICVFLLQYESGGAKMNRGLERETEIRTEYDVHERERRRRRWQKAHLIVSSTSMRKRRGAAIGLSSEQQGAGHGAR